MQNLLLYPRDFRYCFEVEGWLIVNLMKVSSRQLVTKELDST